MLHEPKLLLIQKQVKLGASCLSVQIYEIVDLQSDLFHVSYLKLNAASSRVAQLSSYNYQHL